MGPIGHPGSPPEPGLRLTLTARGRSLVAAATAAHVGDGLGMFVDDRLVLAAIIRAPLGGAFELSLPGSTLAELKEAAASWNAQDHLE